MPPTSPLGQPTDRCRGPVRPWPPPPPPADARQAKPRPGPNDELTATQSNLSTASDTSDLQTLDLAALHTCLGGVSTALNAITASNLKGAVSAITSASSSCLSLDASGGGLVYPFDFPDPFVLTAGGQYYAFATNSVAGQHPDPQVLRSHPLDDGR